MNVEAEIVKHLKAEGFEAYADVPNPRPSQFVTVERTGGTFDSQRIDRPTVAVQAWAKTRHEASELIYAVDDSMRGIAKGTNGITKCSRNSLYNWPDDDRPRYQAVYDLVTIKE